MQNFQFQFRGTIQIKTSSSSVKFWFTLQFYAAIHHELHSGRAHF